MDAMEDFKIKCVYCGSKGGLLSCTLFAKNTEHMFLSLVDWGMLKKKKLQKSS